jgi:hypothetical protein
MTIAVVNPSEFFLTRSLLKEHPEILLNNSSTKKTQEQLYIPGNNSRGNAYKNTKTGFREDIGINVRSNWEANFVRIVNLYKILFEFEPTVFAFPIKRGTKGYTPDFFLQQTNEWIEIKGYLDTKSKTKLKRFKRYYPEEFKKLICIISKYSKEAQQFIEEIEVSRVMYYEDIRSFFSSRIENWEGK